MRSSREIKRDIAKGKIVDDPFGALKEIAAMLEASEDEGRDLVVHALEWREKLEGVFRDILDSMVSAVGLFPYVDSLDRLSLKSALEHAAHRASGRLSDYVLHSAQMRVLNAIEDRKSVILSAPTSFGKSLMIDAAISSLDFKNVIIIVPTIALIEETRRRLTRTFCDYVVVTGHGQKPGDKNIFVMTQERYLSLRDEIPAPDFFVIDEFYKLSFADDGSRRTLLNQVFYDLVETGAQFYLLGPSIRRVASEALDRLGARFMVEDFHAVSLEIHEVDQRNGKMQGMSELLSNIDGQTLVYCQSPASCGRLVRELIQRDTFSLAADPELIDAANWAAKYFHEEWHVVEALRHGVGIHHGRVPRGLSRFMIKSFEKGLIRFLFCTSTLIEGVNTNARNVVIYDNKINRKDLDIFTFNNIRGRSGRMFEHFVGHVYLFDPPPQEELPLVDIPIFNPSESTPTSLLLRLRDTADLPESARKKLEPVLQQEWLPVSVLVKNRNIEPELLIEAAKYLRGLERSSFSRFLWSGRPDYEGIKAVCELIWGQLKGSSAARRSGIYSASQMAFWINGLFKSGSIVKFRKERISDLISNERSNKSPDDAVETVLSFLRNWASFNFPSYLMALESVVDSVALAIQSPRRPNYSHFAAEIEHLFLPNCYAALEEYGLPMEITARLISKKFFSKEDEFDLVISKLRSSSFDGVSDSIFENSVLSDFKEGI